MDGSESPLAYQSDNQQGGSNMSTSDVQRPLYTVPGILHYLQHEWTRFEIDRQQWETERAEFQVGNITICLISVRGTFPLGTDCFPARRTTRTRESEERSRPTY